MENPNISLEEKIYSKICKRQNSYLKRVLLMVFTILGFVFFAAGITFFGSRYINNDFTIVGIVFLALSGLFVAIGLICFYAKSNYDYQKLMERFYENGILNYYEISALLFVQNEKNQSIAKRSRRA